MDDADRTERTDSDPTWAALFERAARHDVAVTDIRAARGTRRE